MNERHIKGRRSEITKGRCRSEKRAWMVDELADGNETKRRDKRAGQLETVRERTLTHL